MTIATLDRANLQRPYRHDIRHPQAGLPPRVKPSGWSARVMRCSSAVSASTASRSRRRMRAESSSATTAAVDGWRGSRYLLGLVRLLDGVEEDVGCRWVLRRPCHQQPCRLLERLS
jgi:hypothetical protein